MSSGLLSPDSTSCLSLSMGKLNSGKNNLSHTAQALHVFNVYLRFASIKVLAVVGFIIFAICTDAGAGQNGYLGFKTWRTPGAFASYLIEGNESLAKIVGFWAVLIQAGFSYQGTELVGIAVGETAIPRKSVPAANKKKFWRILIFFVLSIFMIGD